MTDKVQKIKDWSSKEQDGLMDAQGNFEYPEHEGAYHILCNLDAYIDSLQEEPSIPEIVDEHYWEMLGEEPVSDTQSPVIFYGLTGSVGNTKEAPVNNDFEMALAEMIDKAQKCVVEPLVVAEQWKDELIKLAKSEKPVSEDLKKAYEKYTDERLKIIRPDIYDSSYSRSTKMTFDLFEGYELETAFEEGANWQKEQDQSTIELAEDHAMLAGMEKMKEQMMKDAIELEVKKDAGGYPYIDCIELYDYDKDVPLAKEGDKYKIVLIKED